jgi:pyrimidine-specific ribonucleoside hydrolase
MYNIISKSTNKVSLICTAALTNVALLLKIFPKIKENIEEIIVLGIDTILFDYKSIYFF